MVVIWCPLTGTKRYISNALVLFLLVSAVIGMCLAAVILSNYEFSGEYVVIHDCTLTTLIKIYFENFIKGIQYRL